MDRIARVLAWPPRRCSACGWRGYRFRLLFPSRHGSNPELPAAKLPEPRPEAPPTASPPATVSSAEAEKRRRKHRKHRNLVRAKSQAWKVALVAVGLGAALGFVVLRMGN
ncbi:MAG: hypothetical protein QM765_27140 [Myxococcales bacterium]